MHIYRYLTIFSNVYHFNSYMLTTTPYMSICINMEVVVSIFIHYLWLLLNMYNLCIIFILFYIKYILYANPYFKVLPYCSKPYMSWSTLWAAVCVHHKHYLMFLNYCVLLYVLINNPECPHSEVWLELDSLAGKRKSTIQCQTIPNPKPAGP